MDRDEDSADASANIALVQQVVGHAFDHEDPQALLEWAPRLLPQAFPGVLRHPDPAANARAAYWLARAVWNATPLASNGFLPKPLPEPEPEAPCPCGTGDPYSACCLPLRSPDPPEPDSLWAVLATCRSDAYWLRAEAAGELPAIGLLCIAESCHEYERWRPLRKLAEARLSSQRDCAPADIVCLIDWLSDAYDNLLRTPRKKLASLRQFAEHEAPAVRAAANRRLAAALFDLGDQDASEQAQRAARRAEPNSVATALFEVTMLAGRGEWRRGAERAAHWHGRLRDRADASEEGLDALRALAKDPQRMFEDARVEDAPPELLALLRWIDRNADRPLPHLRWQALRAADDETLRDAYQPATSRSGRLLEEQWQAASGMQKPFSTQPFSGAEPECWQRPGEWIDWLRRHTQALDSLTILDDLAMLLEVAETQLGARNRWRDAVLARGLRTVEKHWPPERTGRLPWVVEANRPPLRLLASFINDRMGTDDEPGDWEDGRLEDAIRLYLRLNPNDNHGTRCPLVDRLLAVGRDAEALACAEGYPRGMFAETRYGAVLALYRLRRLEEADARLGQALADLPLVARYLVASRVSRPKSGSHGMAIGGKEQAWCYRDAMRAVWTSTDGALDWLRQRIGREAGAGSPQDGA